ncbi:MAG TPA: aryl-sulfate sulfotransferase [Pseudomonadales bacterium]|nr:aryl-sulfate sulfotransferase [Pseudomonadales bacterium]
MARSEHHPNGLIHYNPQLAYKGYTLFSANQHYAYLIDMEGRYVHEWRCDMGIANPTLLPNGHLICMAMPSPDVQGQRGLNGQAAACFELDWDSNIVWRYDDPWMHHDYQRLPNGNTLLVKWAPMPKSMVKKVKGGHHAEGDDPNEMLGDLFIEVTPEGEIVKEWKSWAHFDSKTEIAAPYYHRREWSHCNSVSLAPNGDWLISFRLINTIMQVNPKSGKVRWKWCDGTTAAQHDVKYATEKTITIFDNGVYRKSGGEWSRAIEIDAKTKEILWEYTDNPPFSFFTLMGGSADVLPNNNVLICETSKGQFFEVTRDKKVVWEYINPMFVTNPRLGGGRMNMVFRAHRYGPDFPGLAGRDLDPARHANLNRLYGTM